MLVPGCFNRSLVPHLPKCVATAGTLIGLCLSACEVVASEFDIEGIELSIIGGQQFGGEFARASSREAWRIDDAPVLAMALAWPLDSDRNMEIFISQQSTQLYPKSKSEQGFDLDIRYVQVGGTYLLDADRVQSFVSGGLGITHMAPRDRALDDEWRLSLSIGIGAQLPLGRRFGLRFEGRGFGTSVSGNGSLFCGNGRCDLYVTSSMLWQTAVMAGIVAYF